MFNQDTRYLNDLNYRENNASDISDHEQEYSPHESLDNEVHKIAETLKRAAYSNDNIEFEVDCAVVDGFLEKVQGIVRKPWFREAAIIAAILLLKTSLFLVYREARKVELEITNLIE